MNQPYFIVVFAHSLHGRLRRVHVPHQAVYVVLALALMGCFSLFGFVSSYMRMTWKVANYNSLRDELETVRSRYDLLQKQAKQTNQQLANFQVLASEISMAYGIKGKIEGPDSIASEGRLVPTVAESLDQYNLLKSANLSRYYRTTLKPWQTISTPSLWPVNGRMLSHFGQRTDPFSGEGAFHTGVDLSAATGTVVKCSGDGIVIHSEYSGRYGKLVVVDHGAGMQTYYAHLSRFDVITGQTIKKGDTVGLSGGTGRVTSPHLHYEVRVGGTPINPYPYLNRASLLSDSGPKHDLPF